VNGRDMIGAERCRQIAVEGHLHAHDDALAEGILEAAADCYLFLSHAIEAPTTMQMIVWPMHPSKWKPASRIRNLVKAGALYLAEGERYDRARKLDEAKRCRATAAKIAATIDSLS
jgi:hypothetical protein